ncbi:MAG: NAD(+)--rifampin ADP-ribosyltransferase [Bacteroidetes bacterium]|nr:NAD(+)--rifampin ADP-ribosyltransferase [Bacteroidota bacterium]
MSSDTVRDTQARAFAQAYFHGTKANLLPGDFIRPGYASNYGKQQTASYIFLSATLDAAIWGAELAQGDGAPRIYVVEATGELENDPDLTDKKFPGNPTQSFRSKEPFRVIAEVVNWTPHAEELVQNMKAHLARLKESGIESLNQGTS